MSHQPIKYAADQARNLWRYGRANGLIDRLFRLMGAANTTEVVYIAEYANGDWVTAHCTGDPVRAWAYQGNGFLEIEALGDLDLTNPIASRTPVIRYCLSEDGQRMIDYRWNGLRAGYGRILRRADNAWTSDGLSWRP